MEEYPDTARRGVAYAPALRCNQDGTDTARDDVFDLAELCASLSADGWKGEDIAKEIGWDSAVTVTNHKNVREKLCDEGWKLARNGVVAKSDGEGVANGELAKANWTERHFRALLKHLGDPTHPEIATAQVTVITNAIHAMTETRVKVTVFYDGGTYWLADGFHRHEAVKRVPRDTILCDVYEGTKRDAILHSVQANQKHGLRRTNADKRKAVMTLLEDEEWRKWNDSEIARRVAWNTGQGRKVIAELRASILPDSQDTPRKVQRGDTTYTQNTANIGASQKPTDEPAPEPEPIEPDPVETVYGKYADDAREAAAQAQSDPIPQTEPLRQEPPPRTEEQKQQDAIHNHKVANRYLRVMAAVKLMERVDEAIITEIYRTLAKIYHPDKHMNKTAEERALCADAFSVVAEIRDLFESPDEEFWSVVTAKGLLEGKYGQSC